MYELLTGYLKHKSDMVNYEAARAICEMKNVTTSELHQPIASEWTCWLLTMRSVLIRAPSPVLQMFLTSPKSTLKFAAIRTLAVLAQTQPIAVQTCNLDMEKLINDDNRSVATFAITTLLKVSPTASGRPRSSHIGSAHVLDCVPPDRRATRRRSID